MGELGLNLAIGLVTTSCCGCQTAWCWLWWLSPVKAAMVGVGLYKNKICCYLQVVKLLKQSNWRSAIVSFTLFRSLICAILSMVTHCPAFMKINAPRKRLHVEWWGQKFIISFWTYQFERVQRKFSELYSEWVRGDASSKKKNSDSKELNLRRRSCLQYSQQIVWWKWRYWNIPATREKWKQILRGLCKSKFGVTIYREYNWVCCYNLFRFKLSAAIPSYKNPVVGTFV